MTKITRRSFIRQSSCAAIGSTTLMSTLLNLKALNAASFNNSANMMEDYKALVCILFSGGNDSFNMLVPKDSNPTSGTSLYKNYRNTRSNLALNFNSLHGLSHLNGAVPLGLHPSLPKMANLYNNSRNVAFISNIGTLVEPITSRSQIDNNQVQTPLGLLSHSDQQLQWQTCMPLDRSAVGWAGRMADLIQSINPNQNISMNISMSGTNILQTGNTTVEFAVDPYSRDIGISGDNGSQGWLLDEIITRSLDSMFGNTYQDIFKKSYAGVIANSREGNRILQEQLDIPLPYTLNFPDTDLGNSLKLVAELIAKSQGLGHKRQIFFIDYGGWDHHDDILASQLAMFQEVDDALDAFNTAISTQINMPNNVLTFSISEFGRSLTSNGNGTDHAWGGNVMVMGGNVDGGKTFGQYPDIVLGSSLDLWPGQGVFIPTTSTDAYFAEMALWYGVSPTELPVLFPNIGNFYNIANGGKPIGYLKSLT
ncbi:MAG: DUF1501 domain-containing protein [Saprospiraceae bacterium]|nr:DUF1501 domain-containing protein [Saprospiraceae bacterium]